MTISNMDVKHTPLPIIKKWNIIQRWWHSRCPSNENCWRTRHSSWQLLTQSCQTETKYLSSH